MLPPFRDRRPARFPRAPGPAPIGLLGAALWLATLPRAEAQPPPRPAPADPAAEASAPPLALLVLGPDQGVLRERILGQTADLHWTVRVDPTSLPGEPERAAVAALARGTRAGARVVLWLRPGLPGQSPPGLRLFAVDVLSRRFLIRVLATGDPVGTSSATAETAALVVRTTLRSIGLGGSLETSVRVPDTPGDPGADPPGDDGAGDAGEPPAAPGETAPPGEGSAAHDETDRRIDPRAPGTRDGDVAPPETSGRPAVRLGAEAGWGVIFDGGSAPVATGPVLGVRAEVGAVALGLRATPGILRPAQGDTGFRLRRTALDVRVGGGLLRHGPMRVDAHGSAGLSIYGIRPREDALGPTPTRSAGPTLGAGATVGVDLEAGFRLELEVGATLLIRRPTLETREDGVITSVADVWPVQPQGALVVSWRTPPLGGRPQAARDR